MNWWPYEKFSIISPFSPDEIRARLAEQVSPPFTGSFFEQLTNRYPTPFKGYVNISEFKIEPVVVGRNSFIPIIKGRIELSESGSIIYITMAMQAAISHLMIGVVIFLIIAGFGGSLQALKANDMDFLSFTPFGILMFIYLMVIYGFNSESNSCRTFLLELLEGNY
ncbi:hypothetical protein J3L18_12865 [Mucilaginibacter gossypii]|uniref:hypothetical protein n=1 Tax=Mucilaginibacter gossypii TaxID=551996 RepID=UPI000DCD6ABB|nr:MULTISPECIES: hypothetical protein [Mucilaginibacter]QTE39895.1 hypothetical protein J3L18_12865 [Mucilaginibacter gossypii]RAV54480.1 hypothetical protein DIU36_20520 [Mucilaginibacter rubeus]